MSHLRWQGANVLPVAVREALTGHGAPFELSTEPVGGQDHVVFARRPRTLREMLDTQASATPDLPFLISPGRPWTYREALEDINATAALLAERYGVGAGDRVAIVAANNAEYAILMWAVVTLGAIITGLNGWWTTPELEGGIGLTTPVLVAGDERRLARLAGGAVPDGVPVRLLDELHHQAREFAGKAPARADIAEDSPAVILFTSGTTGRPKGATLSHRNIINFALVYRLGAAIADALAVTAGVAAAGPPPRNCSIVSSPMFHVSGMIAVLITGAVFPTTLVFPAPGPWDPVTWLELTARHKVTAWSGVPTQFWRLLRHPDLDRYDIGSVRTVGSGGAVFSPELVRALHGRFPQVRLGNGYGMSETVGLGTLTGGEAFVAAPESVGAAQATVEVQIRGEDGSVLADGEIGEICLRSPSVFLGYWNDPAATRAALDDNRWYRTGDFGRIAEGMLFLESRRRDLILRGGENIYPIEIENRLIDHPDVNDAAVIGVDHPELGQEPKAFIVRRPGSGLTERQVRDWCGAALAAFKVPATVEFTDSLPYSETGKLMKRELERLAGGALTPSPRNRSGLGFQLFWSGRLAGRADLQYAARVLGEELRPHLVFERHVRQVGEDALQAQSHREVAGVDDLVRTPRVGVVDDLLRVVPGRERRGRVVQVGPLEHELHGQLLPRLAAMPGNEDQIGEVEHDDVDPGDLLRLELQPRTGNPGTAEDRDAQVHAGLVDGVHLRVIDRHLREGPGGEYGGRPYPELLVLLPQLPHRSAYVVRVVDVAR